jgi:hypothetical protein
MNCRDATEKLEKMIFEEVPADTGLKQHLDTCSSCGQAYNDALKAREVMHLVRRLEPVLRNPDELTDNIMFAIQQSPDKINHKANSEKHIANGEKRTAKNLQRLLAAASVALFLLFGYEQYGVVKKVTEVEIKFSATMADSCYSDLQRLAPTFDISRAGISFSEIGRFISSMNGTSPQSFSSFKKQINQRKIK